MKKALFLLLICGMARAREVPLIFVSIPPQAWLVRELAGELVAVDTLLKAGANPHSFEPTSRQLRSLAQAKLYLTIGMPFEQVLVQRVAALNRGMASVGMDVGIEKLGGTHHHHADGDDHAAHGGSCCAHDGHDPHIWLEPKLMCMMASNTTTALMALLPERRTELQARLKDTVRGVVALDSEIRERLSKLAPRAWVVYHPSWSYFARSYDLRLIAVEEDGKAPSARHLAGVIKEAREVGVKAVFAEPQYDKRAAATLAKQLGARMTMIDPLAEDWPQLLRTVSERLVEP